ALGANLGNETFAPGFFLHRLRHTLDLLGVSPQSFLRAPHLLVVEPHQQFAPRLALLGLSGEGELGIAVPDGPGPDHHRRHQGRDRDPAVKLLLALDPAQPDLNIDIGHWPVPWPASRPDSTEAACAAIYRRIASDYSRIRRATSRLQ